MIIVAGTIRLSPSNTQRALDDSVIMAAATVSEEGNIAYSITADHTETGLLHVFERYRTPGDLEAHGRSAHMAEFRAAMATWDLKAIDLHSYEASDRGPLRRSISSRSGL